MIMLVVQHTVQDYDQWKKAFDRIPPKAGGALFHGVNRSLDDPNVVAVVAGFPTADAARAFASRPDLAAAMGEAGVISAPRFEYYDEVEAVQY